MKHRSELRLRRKFPVVHFLQTHKRVWPYSCQKPCSQRSSDTTYSASGQYCSIACQTCATTSLWHGLAEAIPCCFCLLFVFNRVHKKSRSDCCQQRTDTLMFWCATRQSHRSRYWWWTAVQSHYIHTSSNQHRSVPSSPVDYSSLLVGNLHSAHV